MDREMEDMMLTANEMTPNDEITVAKRKLQAEQKMRDRHQEVVRQTHPEGCGCGHKVSRKPSLDHLD